MILAIDAGNTNLTIGAYALAEKANTMPIFYSRLSTDRRKTADEIAVSILQLFSLYRADVSCCRGVVIGSVVSSLTDALTSAAKKICPVGNPLILASGVKTGLNIRIDNPAQLGADLLAAAVAIKLRFPTPALIVDLGTATKICALNEKGDFLGCAIAPGVGIGAEALATGTSLLPSIGLTLPKTAIGTNSVDSMRSGVLLGTASMIDGMITRMERELGEAAFCIATGGYAKEIIPLCTRAMDVREDLVLLGLRDVYLKNRC